MAEVVVEKGAQAAQSQSPTNAAFNWFAQYWWVILIVVLVVGLIVLGVYIWWRMQEQERKRDPNYKFFLATVEACKINGRKDFISKKRRWWFLWFSLITMPVFVIAYLFLFRGESWLLVFVWALVGFVIWFLPAFVFYKDRSMRIINVDTTTVGWYRGHCRRQDGNVYLYMKIGRKWLIFDDIVCVPFPENMLTFKTIMVKDETTGEMKENIESMKVEITSYVWNERDNFIKLNFTTIVQEDSFFYTPTLVDKDGAIIDLRQQIANSYHLKPMIPLAEQLYRHLSQVTNQAVEANVGVTGERKLPEKEHSVNANGNPQQ